MSRSITLVGPSAGPSRPATKEETEASWASCVKQRAEGKHTCLSIVMGGKGIDDKAAKLWCAWFERHCASMVSNGRKATAREINFSENRLTGEGIDSICKTLVKLDIPVAVLKLYRNQIHQANAIVDLLSWGKGCIRELHLSHNCLDNQAVLKIILACATITNAKGEHCYPQKASVPIWLRLEMNDKINGPKLGPDLQSHLQRLGHSMRKCICEVDGNSYCCPGACCRECATVPAVHLTYLKLFSRCGPEIVSKKAPVAQPTTAAPGATPRGWGADSLVKPAKADLKPEPVKSAPVPAAPAPAPAPVKIQPDANFGSSDFPSLISTKAAKTAAPASAVPVSRNVKYNGNAQRAEEWQPAQRKIKANAVPVEADFPSLLTQKQVKSTKAAHVRRPATPQLAHAAPAAPPTEAARARGPATPQLHGAPAGYAAVACPAPTEACPPPPVEACPAPPGLDDVPVRFEVPGLDLGFDTLDQTAVSAPPGLGLPAEDGAETPTTEEEPAESEALGAESETLDYVSMLVIRDYDAEADGYVSVAKGDHVNVYLQFQGHGDEGCVYPTYVFAKVDPDGRHGWLPPHVAWERYVDENGRAWAHDSSTGEFLWEDEINQI